MKKFLFILFLFVAKVFSQPITVNTTTYTVPQLVNNILVNTSCINASNVNWQTGTAFGSSNGIGYFQNTNPNFPMQSGVILSTGNVLNAAGPNTTLQSAGTNTWTGDVNLENALAAAGITMVSKNATYIEFVFTPISSNFNFDFLFASEEYGNFQCDFSDSFAFLLTNTITGVTTNLALVPGTSIPISVVTIRDNQFNTQCSSVNQQFFGTYNGDGNALTSATNFNGQTKVINASATLTPNIPYRIKLVIADRNDFESDSAIFLSSNTFNIGQDVLGQDFTVSNNNAFCFGQNHTITTGLSPLQYTFVWTKDGVVIPGNAPSLVVSESGNYGVTYVNIATPCQTNTDNVIIEFLPELESGNPRRLYKCNTGATTYTFNLISNNAFINLGVNPPNIVTYHPTAMDAQNNLNQLPLNYSSPGNVTIYARIKSPDGDCFVIKPFDLLLTPLPQATQPSDYILCSPDTTAVFNLNTMNGQVLALNGPATGIYTVSYHATSANAISGISPLPNSFTSGTTVVHIRVGVIGDSNCFVITTANLIVTPQPSVETLETVITCADYVLQPLNNGNSYFTGDNGTGTQLFPGEIITNSQVLFIYNNSPGCPLSSTFRIVIIKPDELDITPGTYCNEYILPLLEPGQGEYYTAPNGPNGTGVVIPSGSSLTGTQTIYFYFASITPVICEVNPPGFLIDIQITPNYDAIPNYFDCASVVLPALPFGDYYNQDNGLGTVIPAGTAFTSTQTIYAYFLDGICPVKKTINVVIGTSSFPFTQNLCASYTLPPLLVGNYYTGPNGTGSIVPFATVVDGIIVPTVIEVDTTLYVYAPSQSQSGCINNYTFDINVSLPQITLPLNNIGCGTFIIPDASSGTFYTGTGGTGNMLPPNSIINSTTTVYLYITGSGGCTNQKPFDIIVNEKPDITPLASIDVCESPTYTLPPISVGKYYTMPNGMSDVIPEGTIISSPTTLYIYEVNNTVTPPCIAESSFFIDFINIQADEPADVIVCDSYTLPPLSVGNYYTGSDGSGSLMVAGQTITTTTTLFVYATSNRGTCPDENTFTITVNQTPVITAVANISTCGTYSLPVLAVGNYYTLPNKGGVMLNANDVIATTQTIYIYAETGTTPNCFDEISFTITIFDVEQSVDIVRCDSEDYVLPLLSPNNRYYTLSGGLGTQLLPGTIITFTRTIFIYGNPNFSTACFEESDFTVTIVPTPVANTVPLIQRTFCDDDGTNDGVLNLDLTQFNATVLGLQIGTEFLVTYYESLSEAQTNSNPVTSSTITPIFVKVINSLAPDACFDIESISIVINLLPEPNPTSGIVCRDSETNTLIQPYLLDSELPLTGYTFDWYDSQNLVVGNSNTLEVTIPDTYSVIVTNVATGCVSEEVFATVNVSEPAIVTYFQNDEFSDNSTINVLATGVGGDYEYQLDDGVFQDNPTFENVSSGIHTITVRDKNGCGIATVEVLVINYPHFFTPNGDTINDTWNIVDLQKQLDATIFIFDRFGKFIKQVYPSGNGWDGTYNNAQLPSDDYWFLLKYKKEGIEKSFKAHFALKR